MQIGADLLAGLDPVVFAQLLGFSPDTWQAAALRWNGKRALWNIARQSGKSTTAALIACHRAIYYPDSLVLLISPSLRQSGELFRKVRDWLAKLPDPVNLPEDNRLSCTLTNGSRVVSLPGEEKTIRGFSGADLVIEDEAARVDDALYYSVRPMLATSGGRLVLMSTPFGKRGHFFKEWSDGGEAWQRVEIPATQNPRIPAAFLVEERRSMGDWWYQQEYLCKFVETIDQVFNYEQVMASISTEVQPLFRSDSDVLFRS